MKRDEIRLEALKLACHGDRDIPQVLARAEEYEDFIFGDGAETVGDKPDVKKKPGKPRKKADNSGILD
jgi:hypothetical protein